MSLSVTAIREKLKDLKKIGDYKITIANVDYSGDQDFVLELGMGLPSIPGVYVNAMGVRKFYRITIVMSAGPGSEVNAEIWIPENDWNEKMLYIGTGGSGQMYLRSQQMLALYDPYVVVHSDMGCSADINKALEHPAVWIDYGWRGTHMVTLAAKEIIKLVFGKPATYSYFAGGSTGGHQALGEAENCPEDYDGIICVHPAISKTHLHAYFLWNNVNMRNEDGSPKFTNEEIEAINAVTLAWGKKREGAAPNDGFVYNINVTDEDIDEVMGLIKAANDFSEDQLASLKKVYQGPRNPRTGEKIFPGYPIGGELSRMSVQSGGLEFCGTEGYAIGFNYIMAWGLGVPDYEFPWRTYDFDKDFDTMRKLKDDINADTAELADYKARGGKIIMLSGTADACIPLGNVVDYYERVVEKQGSLEATQEFFKFYVVPGFAHSNAGVGGFDAVTGVENVEELLAYDKNINGCTLMALVRTLDNWVVNGEAPDELLATKCNGVNEFNVGDITTGIEKQRMLYPYPDQYEYVNGDPNLPESYRRKEGKLGQWPKSRAERYW